MAQALEWHSVYHHSLGLSCDVRDADILYSILINE